MLRRFWILTLIILAVSCNYPGSQPTATPLPTSTPDLVIGTVISPITGAVETTPEVEAVLNSPRVPKGEKIRFLGAALREAPRSFVLFLQAVVKRGRQQLFREIATEYQALLDVKHNRGRAGKQQDREDYDAQHGRPLRGRGEQHAPRTEHFSCPSTCRPWVWRTRS